MYKYNHSCISVALDFDRNNWILLDFSSKDDAESAYELLTEKFSPFVLAVDYEDNFVNTINRISFNRFHLDKYFVKYIRLHHALSKSDMDTIYSKLVQAMVKNA